LHRHHPQEDHQHPGADLIIGTTPDDAPAYRVALGNRISGTLRRRLRATGGRRDPTTRRTVGPT
jgi:hypothetical protein